MQDIFVYVSRIPDGLKIKPLSVKFRNDEINNATNQDLKKQRYYSFKILEVGLYDGYRLKIDDINLRKIGKKPIADKVYLSISHTDDYVAVAISKKPVGVDIETFDKKRQILDRIFTDTEKVELSKLTLEDDRKKYFFAKWTQKESIFKCSYEEVFSPSKIETAKSAVQTFNIDENSAVLSIGANECFSAKFCRVDCNDERYDIFNFCPQSL